MLDITEFVWWSGCDSNENQTDVLYLFGTHGLVSDISDIVSEALSEFSAYHVEYWDYSRVNSR